MDPSGAAVWFAFKSEAADCTVIVGKASFHFWTERSLAYRRAQKLIESLETVHVPEKAIAQLEERQQLMITAN